MNIKLTALAAFALLTVGLLAWLLTSSTPMSDEALQGQQADEDQLVERPKSRNNHKVRREKEEEAPEEEAVEDIDLPGALPKLKVKTTDGPVVEPTEPPSGEVAAAAMEPPNEEQAHENAIVMQVAHRTATRCWETVKRKHPGAKGNLVASLHLGAKPGGRVVVENLELNQMGAVHPELLACLDRELMNLDLPLPNGVKRVVNAPLHLSPPGEREPIPAGTVAPPPDYAAHPPTAAPTTAPPIEAEAIPPEGLPSGVFPDPNIATGEAVAPPPHEDGARPVPARPIEPPGDAPPPAGPQTGPR